VSATAPHADSATSARERPCVSVFVGPWKATAV
jgi:hypothetical protein